MSRYNFDELRKKLEQDTSFPIVYMFKFILPADNHKLALVQNLFEEDAEMHQKESGKGNYISITIKKVVLSVDDIIAVYEKASEIEGVMVL